MIYGYIRVSTDKQTTENQKLEIKKYCKWHRLKIKDITFISETVSGTVSYKKRKLGSLIESVQEGDTVIITEISRLGRSITMIFTILQDLLNKNVKVIAIKENFELGDNIQSKVLAFAFGLSAEIERQLISERTKQGLERARKEGKQIGHKKGQKNKRKLEPYKDYIKSELIMGRSKLSLAKELGCTWNTLNIFISEYLF